MKISVHRFFFVGRRYGEDVHVSFSLERRYGEDMQTLYLPILRNSEIASNLLRLEQKPSTPRRVLPSSCS